MEKTAYRPYTFTAVIFRNSNNYYVNGKAEAISPQALKKQIIGELQKKHPLCVIKSISIDRL